MLHKILHSNNIYHKQAQASGVTSHSHLLVQYRAGLLRPLADTPKLIEQLRGSMSSFCGAPLL